MSARGIEGIAVRLYPPACTPPRTVPSSRSLHTYFSSIRRVNSPPRTHPPPSARDASTFVPPSSLCASANSLPPANSVLSRTPPTPVYGASPTTSTPYPPSPRQTPPQIARYASRLELPQSPSHLSLSNGIASTFHTPRPVPRPAFHLPNRRTKPHFLYGSSAARSSLLLPSPPSSSMLASRPPSGRASRISSQTQRSPILAAAAGDTGIRDGVPHIPTDVHSERVQTRPARSHPSRTAAARSDTPLHIHYPSQPIMRSHSHTYTSTPTRTRTALPFPSASSLAVDGRFV
ncbi:hypothetical protein B0H16DRAFT_1883644 [Mycena metata]|uniref:Uncharacterized protein n=1 Tax=Mycena metata TaxID=1033252 RepID=A0AAD7JJB0_9AGAR|nr:hypothetical protein B0H16DRAFT_1883644 [Mycena metata]